LPSAAPRGLLHDRFLRVDRPQIVEAVIIQHTVEACHGVAEFLPV
jgi:hypothetical protein